MTNQTGYKEQLHRKLHTDLPFFAQHALFIKPKSGPLEPFVLNKAQTYLHEQAELQLRETGKVRLIVIKGRQQGISTYIAARFYHKATWNKAQSVFILSHHSTTTETLFNMVDRYYANCPPPLRPQQTVSNRRRLQFDNNSQYTVGTAGSGAIGRGDTNQFFHGSEVAFYEDTDSIQTGALQTVADLPGTEIFLESTANGVGNFFHSATLAALQGKSDYRVVFIPWYWQPEYRAEPPVDFEPTLEEQELKQNYGIDNAQLYWRRLKTEFFQSDWKFRQEYPFSIQEAFQTHGASLIDPKAVQQARKATVLDAHKPVVIGCDPARKGDRTVIAIRQGRHLRTVTKYGEMDEMQLAGILSNLITQYGAKKCFVDFGMGIGTVDRLHELGYNHIVSAINFGSKSSEDDKFANKRAEMAFSFKEWIENGPVSIPDDEEIEIDILAVPDFKERSNGTKILVDKDKIREIYGKSPDIFDAICLTFAYPVISDEVYKAQQDRYNQVTETRSPLKTKQRFDSATPSKKGFLSKWDR